MNSVKFSDIFTTPTPTLPICVDDSGTLLPLQSVDISGTVSVLDAALTITQKFVNPSDKIIEVLYKFALPPTAAVRSLTAVLNGHKIVASLAERNQARNTYNLAIAAGKRAVLAEELRNDTFAMRLGNLGPHEEAICTIVFDDTLLLDRFGTGPGSLVANLRLPTAVAPRYGTATDVATSYGAHPDIRIKLSLEALPATSLTFAGVDHVKIPARLSTTVKAGKDVSLSLVLDAPTKGSLPHISPVFALDTKSKRPSLPGDRFVGGTGTLAVTILPPPHVGDQGLDLCIVLDRSGSMNGWKQTLANELVASLIESLQAKDKVGLLAFDTSLEWLDADGIAQESAISSGPPANFSTVTSLYGAHPFSTRTFPHPAFPDRNQIVLGAAAPPPPTGLENLMTAATGPRKALLASWARRLLARGGTDLAETLLAVTSIKRGGKGRRVVTLVVTDGQVSNDGAVMAAAAKLGEVRTIGICDATHMGLLDRLGHTTIVDDPSRLASALDALRVSLRAPQIKSLKLVAIHANKSKTVLVPLSTQFLVAGIGGTISARSKKMVSLQVTAVYHDGTKQTAKFPVALVKSSSLRLRWSRTLIRQFEREVVLGTRSSEDLVDLSLATGVLCSVTAFVAVGDEVDGADGSPCVVEQPNAFPFSGMTSCAFVGQSPMLRGQSMPVQAMSFATFNGDTSVGLSAGTSHTSQQLQAWSTGATAHASADWLPHPTPVPATNAPRSTSIPKSTPPYAPAFPFTAPAAGSAGETLADLLQLFDTLLPSGLVAVRRRTLPGFKAYAVVARANGNILLADTLDKFVAALSGRSLVVLITARADLAVLLSTTPPQVTQYSPSLSSPTTTSPNMNVVDTKECATFGTI